MRAIFRRDCIVISGIPNSVKHGFDLKNTEIDIVKEFGANIVPDDIAACHRLQKKRGSRYPANVIVKFVNRKVAEICLSHLDKVDKVKNVREKLGYNVRIYESLCKANSDAVRVCTWLKSNDTIHDFFIRNGFSYIVENEGEKPRKINHPTVLRNTFPEIDTDFDVNDAVV